MGEGSASREAERELAGAPRRAPCFGWRHLGVVGVCLGPLNPIVVWDVLHPHFGIHWSLVQLVGMGSLVFGAYAPRVLEGRAEIPVELVLVPGVVLLAGAVLQMVWRPRGRWGEAVRLGVWGVGWWVWMASGLVSFANQM